MIFLTPVYIRENDPRFNKRKNYLVESIQSVRAQKEPHLQIVIDDGSPHGALADIQKMYGDGKTIFLRRERKEGDLLTCTNALNHGLNYILSSEHFTPNTPVSFLHSDDIAIHVGKREDTMQREGTSFLYSGAIIFFDGNPEGTIWDGLENLAFHKIQDFWIQGKLPYPTMTWTKKLLQGIQEFSARKYGQATILDSRVGCGEDVDIALTTFEFLNYLGETYSYFPEITAGYRIHSSSLSEIRDQRARKREENYVLIKHFGKRNLPLLHLKRFFCRPEEYLSFLFPYALKKKRTVKLEDYL